MEEMGEKKKLWLQFTSGSSGAGTVATPASGDSHPSAMGQRPPLAWPQLGKASSKVARFLGLLPRGPE